MSDRDIYGWPLLIGAAIVCVPLAIGSQMYVGSHAASREEAGHFVSAQLSGNEGGATLGMTLTGRTGVVVVPDTTLTLVTTDRAAVAIDGIFTARVGEALEIETMLDGSKKLCIAGDSDSCKPIAK